MTISKRLLILLAGLLVALLAGSIVWGATQHRGTAPASAQVTPRNATILIDKLLADVSAGKANAATALFTHDAIIWQGAETWAGTAQIRKHIADAKPSGFIAKRVAPVTVNGTVAATFYKASRLVFPALSVYQFRNGRIHRIWDFELSQTIPFTNTQLP